MKETLSILNNAFERISAKWYIADNPNGVTILINSAIAVKQNYYSDYARFLASEGYQVYTYDFTGIGKSKTKGIRKYKTNIMDWANSDYTAMISHVREKHPGNTLVVLGHSIGGQIIGMTDRSQKVDTIMMIASQTPYWKNYAPGMKPRLWFFWDILIPALTGLFGYFPASKIGLFEDLPKHVALQWRRWAKSPNYIFDEYPDMKETFQALNHPTLVLSFEDDTIAPRNALADLLQHLPNLKIDHRHIAPDDIAVRSVGHFGFFRKRFKATLWKDSVDWLRKNAKKRQRIAA